MYIYMDVDSELIRMCVYYKHMLNHARMLAFRNNVVELSMHEWNQRKYSLCIGLSVCGAADNVTCVHKQRCSVGIPCSAIKLFVILNKFVQ